MNKILYCLSMVLSFCIGFIGSRYILDYIKSIVSPGIFIIIGVLLFIVTFLGSLHWCLNGGKK